jgi:hypothetical protein
VVSARNKANSREMGSGTDADILTVMLPFDLDPTVENERTIRGRLGWTEDLKTINK